MRKRTDTITDGCGPEPHERPKAASGPPQAPLVKHYVMRLRNAYVIEYYVMRYYVMTYDVVEDYVMSNVIT